MSDILIALIDGLTGLPEALHAVFPQTVIHQRFTSASSTSCARASSS